MRQTRRPRFRIEHKLGRGATCEVFAAVAQDGTEVALKLARSLPELMPDVRRCFEREVRAARLVKSAYVPAAHDWRLAPGAPYIAFDRVRGRTLAEVLRLGPLPLGATVDLGCQLLRALRDVHAAGLLHCDVKPSNILLAPDAKRGVALMLVDFGIMRDVDEPKPEDAVWTFGTPAYMSPEQVLGGALDARSDVYSASVVLYMALTGRRPFAWSPDPKKLLWRVLGARVPAPRSVRADCPAQLEKIVLRGLARSPDERFQSVATMRAALERFARRAELPRGQSAWDECDRARFDEIARAA